MRTIPRGAEVAYTGVYDLIINLYLYPDRGDEILTDWRNKGLFDNRFFSCLSTITQNYMQYAQNHYSFCDRVYTHQKSKEECYRDNEPAKVYQFLKQLDRIARNEMNWSSSSIVLGYNLAVPFLGKKGWEQLIHQTVPQQKPLLICQ